MKKIYKGYITYKEFHGPGRVGLAAWVTEVCGFAAFPKAAISANPEFCKQAVCERSSQLLTGPVSFAVLLWEQRLTLFGRSTWHIVSSQSVRKTGFHLVWV